MKLNKTAFYWVILLMIGSGSLWVSSCKKDKINQGGDVRLDFLIDTLTFDTLFVTLGSTTKSFTVRNTYSSPVEISKIYLKNGGNSSYRLTIDGDQTNTAQNVIIPAKDSIYIFVEVTVDPSGEALPFVIEDEVVFEINGNRQQVALQAYGQNAHFFNGEAIQSQTWTNDLPYVVLNSIEIEKGHTLTIKEGVTVYFGGNSGMFVNGTLKIEGGQDTSQWVTFRGYRLDKQVTGVAYDQLPGQWLGMFLMRGSGSNEITNFRMRGSQYGLNIGNTTLEELNNVSINNAPDLKITNSVIHNSSVYGLYGFLAKIHATNLLIYDAGRNAFTATLGGQYRIEHSNFYLRSSNLFDHKEPSVYLSDYHVYNSKSPALRADLEAVFINTVIDGTAANEILYDILDMDKLESTIENSAVKSQDPLPAKVIQNANIFNQDNGYADAAKSDFRLKENSILIDKGKDIMVPFDIEGKLRSSTPDIGAFEY